MDSRTPGTLPLFVYGTLRAGGPAAALLSGCEYVGVRRMEGVLYDVRGTYPALVPGEGGEVEGEIWRCPAGALARLDEYEGVAEGLFRRVRVEVDGAACWTYVAGPRLLPTLTPDRRIPSGRWPPE